MKLTKTELLVLEVIDGKKPFDVIMKKGSHHIRTRRATEAIENLKAVGIIYRDTNTSMLKRTIRG